MSSLCRNTGVWVVIATCFTGFVCPLASAGDAPTVSKEQRDFFETRIRPVLVTHCFECHAQDSKEIGGKLLLDSASGLRAGGESGAIVTPGEPDQSLLIQSLRHETGAMPPDEKLPDAVINDFVQWVKTGAADPRTEAAPTPTATEQADAPQLWSLQPVQSFSDPTVADTAWAIDSLDRFVQAGFESAGVAVAGDAAPEVLIRRLYADLTGLRPTPEQHQAFVKAYQSHGRMAVEQLVDELLASPHFGERWGRHWLDIARYGESNGNDGLGRNPTFASAWRYRDYVIDALNRDIPYDRFLSEQIAGDLLPAETDGERDRLLIATGFLAIGSKPAKAMNDNFAMDVVNDQIDVISTGVMGLSVACARCHDHKHDPVPTKDYYALAGIFTSTETLWGPAANEALTAPSTPLHQLKGTAPLPAPTEVDMAVFNKAIEGARNKPPQPKAGSATAMGVRDAKTIADCKIHINGETKSQGEAVPRGFLSACNVDSGTYAIGATQSGRVQLAEWLTSPDHPLTARVMVNRTWLHLFGRGIVSTPDDFGTYGTRPSHPQLLDHLALRFMHNGWSVKQMIRAIVLSRTYQLGSDVDVAIRSIDPDNRLFARHDRQRLDAESLRDQILQVSGQLEAEPGTGSDVQHLEVLVNELGSLHRENRHRSVYLCLLRNSPPPELAAFDLPDAIRPAGARSETILPTQSLFLMNSPFLVRQSQKFAERILQQVPDSDENTQTPEQLTALRIQAIYESALNRAATDQEVDWVLQCLQQIQHDSLQESENADAADTSETQQLAAWAVVCQAVLVSNEFRYVD
ncbi:MAG: PSD1 domain-containing protein [Planctomycetaceae bacterium]|nr:PSD1 domain-containing protein [Planctomycetaceae bacterium]